MSITGSQFTGAEGCTGTVGPPLEGDGVLVGALVGALVGVPVGFCVPVWVLSGVAVGIGVGVKVPEAEGLPV